MRSDFEIRFLARVKRSKAVMSFVAGRSISLFSFGESFA